MYVFCSVSFIIPAGFLTETDMLIIRFIWKFKRWTSKTKKKIRKTRSEGWYKEISNITIKLEWSGLCGTGFKINIEISEIQLRV